MSTAILVAPLIQAFFIEHLMQHKGASPQTVRAYRDAFRLLLTFVHEQTGKEPADLELEALDASVILSFLDDLERRRNNTPRSRNARLVAVRSFFRYLAFREPQALDLTTRVLAIPTKRAQHPMIGYLTRTEMESLLAAPDRSSWSGRRDHGLLLTLYNTGARVSEIASLRRSQVTFADGAHVQLHGKGRKERRVPLWTHTARVLQNWFRELGPSADGWAFPSARGAPLSRHGVGYIVTRTVQRCVPTCPSLADKRVSPHVIRHTTAMHLLQAGVDPTVIALWLGHERLETTHMYVEADLQAKEKALGKLTPPDSPKGRFKADDTLLAFLATL